MIGCLARLSRAGQRLSFIPDYLTCYLRTALLWLAALPCVLAAFGMAAALIWAFADIWRYPSALPDKWGLGAWGYAVPGLVQAGLNSLLLGLISAGICIVLAILWLQTSARPHARISESLIYTPLLLPQAAFLFGVQILLIWLGFDGYFAALVWAHGLFVFPYVMLSLAPAWRRFDERYLLLAACLGAGPIRRFLQIRLPIMMIPLLTAFAVGFAVSSALYLPTVFAGNGRVITLTTEAVTLAAGASRQNLGIASLMQMALPLMVFVLADFYGRLRFARFSWFQH